MGYTHYWVPGSDDDGYKKAIVIASCIVEDQAEMLWHEYDEENTAPTFGTRIFFNGQGDDGHETFILPTSLEDISGFEFCKTARKPYDVVVTAVLATMVHVAPDSISVSSDGDAGDWEAGIRLARLITELDIRCPLEGWEV